MNTKDIILYSAVVVLVLTLLFVTSHPSLQHIKPVDNTIEIEKNNAKIDSLTALIECQTFKVDSIQAEYDKKKVQIKYKIIYNEKKYNSILSLDADSSLKLFHSNFR